MELLLHIAKNPIGLASIGLLVGVFTIGLHSRRTRSAAIASAYRSLGFEPLSSGDLYVLMQVRDYKLLRNPTLSIFRHSRSFIGSVNNRQVIQCKRTKYSVHEKYGRFTTVTQVKPTINLPAFSLQVAPLLNFYLTGKPQNRIHPSTDAYFSSRFELCSSEDNEVLALFNDTLCKELMSGDVGSIESNGEHVVFFQNGRRIYKADDVEKFVKHAVDWVEKFEVAYVAANDFADDYLSKAA